MGRQLTTGFKDIADNVENRYKRPLGATIFQKYEIKERPDNADEGEG